MRRLAIRVLYGLLAVCAATGCVHRELEIFTRPPGATVEFDGQILEGTTPIRIPFTWYGTHEIVVEKPGYSRERLVAHLRPPWYQRFPLDIFPELLWPGRILDRHTYPIVLLKERPLQELSDREKTVIKEGLLDRAERFRRLARERVGPLPKPDEPKTD